MEIKIIAITGATSSIGVALTKLAISKNIKVLAFVNPKSINIERVPNNKLVKIIPCGLEDYCSFDINNYKVTSETLRADVFFHLAWGHTNRLERNDPELQIDNIKYSIESVKIAENLGCHTYIGAGSQAEYGPKDFEINESTSATPISAYGITKLCSGQLTRLACNNIKIRHIWPRIFSTYGPYTQESTIIAYTINCIKNNESPKYSPCNQIWDFLYVKDAANALFVLAKFGKNNEIYNVAYGQSRPLKEYLYLIKDSVGKNINFRIGELPYSQVGPLILKANTEKLTKLGFKAKYSFEKGIDEYYLWNTTKN
ncbi:MAG: NAD(P)-dependent oxidoreductase [Succinivibrio sp.]|nr:NAD(P)-dependent oxidoreductase [Succinivibrio sp.]